jgi:iron complex outermembrane receptor protein
MIATALTMAAYGRDAAAQAAAPVATPSNQNTLSEVIVTAQRRKENLQDVPLAISAIGAQQVRESAITNLMGIAQRVPSLTVLPFAPGQTIIALRGVSSNDDGAGTDNSVAVFTDGVYSGRLTNINTSLFDIQSIEVLRGPQGTLYGKNTIGGAIVITTTRPDEDRVDEKIQVDVGNYNLIGVQARVSGPLGDGWAGKLAVNSTSRDGWADNVYLNIKEHGEQDHGVHGQLLYDKGGPTLLLSANYDKFDGGDIGRVPLTQVTGNLGPIVDEYNQYCGHANPFCTANPVDGYSHLVNYGFSAQVDDKTSIGQITSITAYTHNHVNSLMDSTGIPEFVLGNYVNDSTDQWSQEVRLAGQAGNFKYVGGAFYLNERTDRLRLFTFDNTFADASYSKQDNVTNSYALFGQTDWAFLANWVLSVGARLTEDTKSIHNDSFSGDFPIIETTFSNSRSASWGAFTPKATLAWHPAEDTTLYVTYAKGFKSGGFAAEPTAVQDTNPLKAETATNYEFGYKAELFHRTLRFNGALFDTEYKDLQFQEFGPAADQPGFGVFRTVNLASARARGAELEADWKPVHGLTLSGSYGYLDAKYIHAQIPTSDYPDQDGQEMIRAPRNKYSASGQYTYSLGEHGDLTAIIDYEFTDKQRGETEPYAIQPAYGLANARLAWAPTGHMEIALWVRNFTQEAYIAHTYTIGGEVIGTYGDPRTFGLSVTLKN